MITVDLRILDQFLITLINELESAKLDISSLRGAIDHINRRIANPPAAYVSVESLQSKLRIIATLDQFLTEHLIELSASLSNSCRESLNSPNNDERK